MHMISTVLGLAAVLAAILWLERRLPLERKRRARKHAAVGTTILATIFGLAWACEPGFVEGHQRGGFFSYDTVQPGAYRVPGGTVIPGPAQSPGCGGGAGQYPCAAPVYIPDRRAQLSWTSFRRRWKGKLSRARGDSVMTMQWREPQIETRFTTIPGEIFWINGRSGRVLKHVATVYEDLRPALRINSSHSHSERGLDCYWTPKQATRALMAIERLPLSVADPCCGSGAILDVLRSTHTG